MKKNTEKSTSIETNSQQSMENSTRIKQILKKTNYQQIIEKNTEKSTLIETNRIKQILNSDTNGKQKNSQQKKKNEKKTQTIETTITINTII